MLAICAALRPEKRHLDFLHAVRQLVDEGLDLRALLIGDGPERPRIEAYCREHALLDRCRITGFQMDVRPWLASADVCLLTSSTETFPMALLEAMSMGRAGATRITYRITITASPSVSVSFQWLALSMWMLCCQSHWQEQAARQAGR